jgi:hypothetical protein
VPKCKVCKKACAPSGVVTLCSYECAHALSMKADASVKAKKVKAAKEAKKVFNRNTKELKKGIKRRKEWVNDLQALFNIWVRFRDKEDPCISCGRTNKQVATNEAPLRGGLWDAGHYHSRGAREELSFNRDNCHKQCKSCNGGSGKYARKNHTVGSEYKERLIIKIGLERVELLNTPHPSLKEQFPTIDDIRVEIARYRKLIKDHKADS